MTPRGNMLGCPLAGIDVDEILDATAVLNEVNAFAEGNKDFSNLPRKWKTAISGCRSHCTVHEINDISFVGVEREDGSVGFDLWVGGGLSTNPMFARRLGVFVTAEQVKEVWTGVTSIFRDYGYRRLRTRARVKFLMADWGPEKFREVLEKEYLGYALPGRTLRTRCWFRVAGPHRCPTGRRTASSTSASRPRWGVCPGRCSRPWPSLPTASVRVRSGARSSKSSYC